MAKSEETKIREIPLSPFEERFGQFPNHYTEEEKYDNCLAAIRDQEGNSEILEEYANPNSLSSEPLCVLFALYDAMEELKFHRSKLM